MIIIRNGIIPFKGYKAMNLFGILFYRKEFNLDLVTFNHEKIHTAQMVEMLFIFFYLFYFLEWLILLCKYKNSNTAYRHISYEQEAYMYEKDLSYLSKRKHYAWMEFVKQD